MTVQVFVSYRRGDSPHAAGRLVDRLDEHFKLFIDVDRIRPGADFTSVVREAVDNTDVLVAVIGLQWLTLTADNGGRRIDQPGDWVAEEIGTALRRGTPVIPVLVDGAHMPSTDELPPALADLANRQALKISHESFSADSRRLIETIKAMVSAATPETVNLWDDPDYPQARGAFLQGHWPAAIEGFEQVLRRHPRLPHVVEQLEQARRSQQLLDLDASAENAAEAGRWQEVVDALKAIDVLQPSDDINERLSRAQLRLRINELQNDIRALAKTGNWAAVMAADIELARLDAEAADPEGLATKARAELLEAKLVASITPAALPDGIKSGLENPHVHIRLGAVAALGEWLTDSDPARAVAARQALQHVAESDLPRVAAKAHALLSEALAPTKIEPLSLPQADSPAVAPDRPENEASQVRPVVHAPEFAPARRRRRPLIIIAALAALAVVGTLTAIMLLNPERTRSPRTLPDPSSATSVSSAGTDNAPLLADDFHTQAYGWKGLEGPGGLYVNDVYRIVLKPRIRGETSSPRNASSVYPLAPSDLRIEVEARSLDPLDNRSGYGVTCHLNKGTNDRYQFTIGDGGEGTVRITKFLVGRDPIPLATKSVASLNATDVNKIRAECVDVKNAEESGVRLVFSLNDKIVARATDWEPLPVGTIGIRAFAGQGGIRAEFDNFVVTRV